MPAEELARLKATEDARQIESEATPVAVTWPRDRARYVVTVWLREGRDEFECVSFAVTSLRPGASRRDSHCARSPRSDAGARGSSPAAQCSVNED